LTSLDDCYAFRIEIVERLERDLLGPDDPAEILDDPPLERYGVGVLYPVPPDESEKFDASQDDETHEQGDRDTTPDPPVAMASSHYPSTMGITFAVDTHATTSIRVAVGAARYSAEEEDEAQRWRRRALDIEPVSLDVSIPSDGKQRIELADGLELYARIRPADDQGASAVTVALINTRIGKPGHRDADAFFQPSLSVVDGGGQAVFVERRASERVNIDDSDLRSYRLLYRHAKTFAVGHGCSADWDLDDAAGRATAIRSAFIPSHALRLADSNPEIQSPALSLLRLVQAPKKDILTELRALCDQYHDWIGQQIARAADLGGELGTTAGEHIAACRETETRMRRGIDVLENDAQAWEAFRLANKAMLQQRARSSWLHDNKPTPQPELDGSHAWRPFQLAFVLQCLPGIVDPSLPEREIADLLWFPTGGGKTEAYLGLIAFVAFLRRLRDDSADGVAVIMRYTLRLLTIQQFDRAALLITACEMIRRDEPTLGNAEISLGLWVGQDGTPNDLAQARIAITKLRDEQDVETGNPVQLHSCPWCGARLTAWQYEITNDPKMRVRCRDKDCPFSKIDIPVYLVDEDVYRYRPTLLIATSDKFATIPWREATRSLFNKGHACRPPELIVQDELHLISGPLGTLAGLYETAVDFLCSNAGRPPKIIASTATIRRAAHQTRGLFTRDVRQFPPPGIDARDSWFAVEAPPDARGTRLYVGLMAPGISPAVLLIRTYASLLQSAFEVPGTDGARDPYWTLVGYFNSLRVLSGARMQVQDDVGSRLELIAKNGGPRPLEPDSRIELTSRESSSDIPSHLKRMEKAVPDEDALDVILATNMISVGVDIDRLGLMVVMGQPQSTSEYIQSTSRVGRRHPGLVITLFNSGRSRDRSHYESFKGYHSALYRQVESTSVTPFSPRARDRGLHAVLVALARLTIPGLAENASAGRVADHRAELELLINTIVDRVRAVDVDQVEPAERELRRILQGWEQRATLVKDLRYHDFQNLDRTLLLDAGRVAEAQVGTLPTLWSLRDVDQESNLYLTRL
jgi:hypothetical protein